MELSEQFTDKALQDFMAYALADREAEYIRRNYHFHFGDRQAGGSLVVVYCYPASSKEQFRAAFIYTYNDEEISVWERKLDLSEKSMLLNITVEQVLTKLRRAAKSSHEHLLDSELRKYFIDQFLENEQ